MTKQVIKIEQKCCRENRSLIGTVTTSWIETLQPEISSSFEHRDGFLGTKLQKVMLVESKRGYNKAERRRKYKWAHKADETDDQRRLSEFIPQKMIRKDIEIGNMQKP